ncbi:hypothetical protein ACKWCC_07960 [Maribacter sp. 2307ULW6-5]
MVCLTACTKDDPDAISQDPPQEDPVALTFKDMESDWVRLTLMGENKLDVMQADSGDITYSVAGPLVEGARYYVSNSGRYQSVVDRNGGKVRFFDSGIVNHEDHGHEYEAKWANAEINSVLPTHLTGSGGHIVVFNDGDGSISYVNESQLEIPSYQPETFTFNNTVAHHGVGIRLNSGKFAVTFKNTEEPGGIPQMVMFVNGDGTVIDNNGGVEVVGIHGSANNGAYGAFGSTDGIIVVDDRDNIDLIPYTDGKLRNEPGFWLGTLKSHQNSALFYGRARNLGIYTVDPEAKSILPLYEGANVVSDMFSFNGAFYLLLTDDGNLRVYDANTATLLTERVVEMAEIPDAPTVTSKSMNSEIAQLQKQEEPSPVLVCSDKFLYVLAPNRTQIKVLKIESLEHVHTIDLETPVISMMKNGFSIEGDQNPDYEH